jgi:hypothetical protein
MSYRLCYSPSPSPAGSTGDALLILVPSPRTRADSFAKTILTDGRPSCVKKKERARGQKHMLAPSPGPRHSHVGTFFYYTDLQTRLGMTASIDATLDFTLESTVGSEEASGVELKTIDQLSPVICSIPDDWPKCTFKPGPFLPTLFRYLLDIFSH